MVDVIFLLRNNGMQKITVDISEAWFFQKADIWAVGQLILYVFKSSAKKNQKASQMLDCASAKPQEVASRKYTPEKKTFKALWKVSYRERFTILLGLSFENKTHNVRKALCC